MSKSLKILIASAALAALVTPALAGTFNLGREATPDEVAANPRARSAKLRAARRIAEGAPR